MAWLEFDRISKCFPGVTALDRVSFGVEKGACHALIGENGAGKSTLGKILSGVQTADSGQIRMGDRVIAPADPLAARRLGVAIVHQELAFCANLTVAENLCMGDLPRRAGFVSRAEMREKARTMLAEIEAAIDPDVPINELTTGQEQMVQIAAALGVKAQVIVMDEPTSSLSAVESEHLFRLLAKLKERAITVLYVSHRMEEIFRLCDSMTVLRDGKHVSTVLTNETTPERIVQQMIGRDLKTSQPRHTALKTEVEMLRVSQYSSPGKFRDISFSLRAGEILGLAGLVGAGRSEIAQAIFGLDARCTGKLYVRCEERKFTSTDQALNAGIGFLPEDRKRQGLVLSMNCLENGSLAALPLVTKIGFLQRTQEAAMVQTYVDQLQVKAPGLKTPISGLSGGNQQKIALAKWLARRCAILIVDEPTRGVDVGAKAEIHQLLDQLASEGTAILLISSELPEIIGLARRIIVLREGAQMGELRREEFSQTAVMRLMAGLAT